MSPTRTFRRRRRNALSPVGDAKDSNLAAPPADLPAQRPGERPAERASERSAELIVYLYLSRAASPLSLSRLSEWGRHFGPRNKERGVTGLLLTVGDHFVQLIEGPRSTVLTLAETIKQDPRHQDFRVLAVRPIRRRSFGRWAMRLMRLEDRLYLGVAEIAALRAEVRQLVGQQHAPPEAFLDLLHALPAVLKRNRIDAASLAALPSPG